MTENHATIASIETMLAGRRFASNPCRTPATWPTPRHGRSAATESLTTQRRGSSRTKYDIKLLTVGLSTGHDQAVLRGDPETSKFSVVSLKEGRVLALDCLNRQADFVQGKKFVEAGLQIDSALLADVTVSLKGLLTAS